MTTTSRAKTLTIPAAYPLPIPTFQNQTGAVMPNTGDWQGRHIAALHEPRPQERPYLAMIAAWQAYATAHQTRYGTPIGEDGYAGPYWAEIGGALIKLLSMDHGSRLDSGTLDGLIRDIATAHGIDSEDL
jgi:hypothetical protein